MIVNFGQLVADIVVKPVDGYPEVGTAERVDVIDLRTGGCALNTATVLQKLSVQTTVIGKIGTGVFGRFLLKTIDNRGIDTRGVIIDSNVSTSSVIVMISKNGGNILAT